MSSFLNRVLEGDQIVISDSTRLSTTNRKWQFESAPGHHREGVHPIKKIESINVFLCAVCSPPTVGGLRPDNPTGRGRLESCSSSFVKLLLQDSELPLSPSRGSLSNSPSRGFESLPGIHAPSHGRTYAYRCRLNSGISHTRSSSERTLAIRLTSELNAVGVLMGGTTWWPGQDSSRLPQTQFVLQVVAQFP